MTISRSLEQTQAGLCFKAPKTKSGRREIGLPPIAIEALKEHRLRQLEMRVKLGLGKLNDDALIFTTPDGAADAAQQSQPRLGAVYEGAQVAADQLSQPETSAMSAC